MKTPLVLLHGFPLDNAMWYDQVEYFQDKYPIICPDLPGFGNSDEDAPETIEGFAGIIKNLLDENGVGEVILGGFSMGGYIAFAFYDMFPKLVKGLVFIDTRAGSDSEEGRAGRDNSIRSLEREGVRFFADAMPQKLLSENGMKDKELLKYIRDMILNQKTGSVKNALAAMRDRKDRNGILDKIDVPALFICGEKDVLTPADGMRSMAEKVKGSSFRLIKGAGHLSNLEDPEAFNNLLEQYFEDIREG